MSSANRGPRGRYDQDRIVARRDLVHPFVPVMVVAQVAGLLLAQAALDHDPGMLMAWIQGLPPGVRTLFSPLIVVALPALVVTLVVGVVVFGGLELTGIVIPVDPTYPLFVASAYGVAVLFVAGVRRLRRPPATRVPAVANPYSSRLWYWVAAYVAYVGPLLGSRLLALLFGFPLFVPVGSTASVVLFGGGAVVSVLAVVAVYVDGVRLGRADSAWQPPPLLYASGIALGTIAYPIGPLVGLHYLLSRHRFLGKP